MYMDDYVKQLDSVLSSGNRKLLTGAGSVSHKQALEKAKAEYRKYQEITLTPVEKAYLESIKEVSKEVKRRQHLMKKQQKSVQGGYICTRVRTKTVFCGAVGASKNTAFW